MNAHTLRRSTGIVIAMLGLAVFTTCGEKPDTQEAAPPEAAYFPAQLDSTFFSTDTVSFSRYDKKHLSEAERLALLRTAIVEADVFNRQPIAFFERSFADTSDLLTYERRSSTGNGTGRAEIFVLDFNGDETDDLIARYSNGADDNACIFFAKLNGRYKYLFITGAYINHIDYANGMLKGLRYVSLACCTYPYNTFREVEVVGDTLRSRFNLRVPSGWNDTGGLKLLGRAKTKKGAQLQPHRPKSIEDTAADYDGTRPITASLEVAVYGEKVMNGETWLRVMEPSSAQENTYTMGWVLKADTDWRE